MKRLPKRRKMKPEACVTRQKIKNLLSHQCTIFPAFCPDRTLFFTCFAQAFLLSFGVFLSPLTFCCVIYIIVSVSIQKAIRSEMLRLRVCFVTFAPCTSSTRRSSALQNAQSELFLTLRPQAERIALFSRQRIKVYWTYTN